MKRLLCGSVVLAASLGLVSCNGDPTSDFRDGPTRILAEPSVVFVNQAGSQEVVFTLTDDAGDPFAAETWEITETGSGISVERNLDFLGTTTGAPLQSEVQFVVTAGDAPAASRFIVSADGLEDTVEVNVLPTAVATATFSNATPALNEPVTLTAEGYTFLPEASVVIGADSALIISNDGTSLTFLPAPGGTGPAQLGGININLFPTVPLSLPTAAEITVPPLAAAPGTDAPGTAPALPIPAEGQIAGFFDGPDFATGAPCATGTICRFYGLNITEEGLYTVTLDWDIGGDIDMYLCPDPGEITGSCDFQAATGAHPEVGVYALTPGFYTIIADDFGLDAAGTQLSFTIQHDPPLPALRLQRPTAHNKVRK
jgi:hypothetical protein